MDKQLYELIAYIARYWFALLMLVIIWRAVHWLRFNANRNALVKSMLPDAGFIGEWVVLRGEGQVHSGTTLSATRDGWIGSGRTCDVRIHAKGIPKRVARFYLRTDGLHLLPQKMGLIEVDGTQVQQEAIMRHGATMTIGDITIQLRLFAGILLAGEIPLPPLKKRMESHIMDDTEADDIEAHGMKTHITETADHVSLPQPVLSITVRRNRGRNSGQKTPDTYQQSNAPGSPKKKTKP